VGVGSAPEVPLVILPLHNTDSHSKNGNPLFEAFVIAIATPKACIRSRVANGFWLLARHLLARMAQSNGWSNIAFQNYSCAHLTLPCSLDTPSYSAK
jgi:hypothetical protein